MQEDLWIMCKGYGKHIWMDERKMKFKIKDGKKIINGKIEAWKDMYGRLVWMKRKGNGK